jgi:hypothetical protein
MLCIISRWNLYIRFYKMQSILYNSITLKIEDSENSASEDSRSQKTWIYNNFTKRLIGNSLEIIGCYMTSKCIANNNKKTLCICCQTIYENTPYKYTMECILKIGTGSATKIKSPKPYTNKPGYVSTEYRFGMFTLLLSISHFMTIHWMVLLLLHIGKQNDGVSLLCTMQGCKYA